MDSLRKTIKSMGITAKSMAKPDPHIDFAPTTEPVPDQTAQEPPPIGPPVRLAVIGAGQRGKVSNSSLVRLFMFVMTFAIAEPRPETRERMAQDHQVGADRVFNDWKDLLAACDAHDAGRKDAQDARYVDGVVVTVQDHMHAEVVIPFARRGYHILCEKPMATTPEECIRMADEVEKSGLYLQSRTVRYIYNISKFHPSLAWSKLHLVGLVCGGGAIVLRYSKYNQALREVIASGSLGKLVNVVHVEPVGHYHFAHSYVRGNWNQESKSSFSLMTKSCHDIDLLCHFFAPATPVRFSSFGSLTHFRKSEKPAEAGSATRCLDCPVQNTCPYSASRIYLTGNTGWPVSAIVDGAVTKDKVMKELEDGPYGMCVYESPNDVCDHQVVNIEFSNGTTASFTMVAFTKLICERQTRLHLTHGEVVGDSNVFTTSDFRTNETRRHRPSSMDAHGDGDMGVVREFVQREDDGGDGGGDLGYPVSEVLRSHLAVFCAEKARRDGTVILFEEFERERGPGTVVWTLIVGAPPQVQSTRSSLFLSRSFFLLCLFALPAILPSSSSDPSFNDLAKSCLALESVRTTEISRLAQVMDNIYTDSLTRTVLAPSASESIVVLDHMGQSALVTAGYVARNVQLGHGLGKRQETESTPAQTTPPTTPTSAAPPETTTRPTTTSESTPTTTSTSSESSTILQHEHEHHSYYHLYQYEYHCSSYDDVYHSYLLRVLPPLSRLNNIDSQYSQHLRDPESRTSTTERTTTSTPQTSEQQNQNTSQAGNSPNTPTPTPTPNPGSSPTPTPPQTNQGGNTVSQTGTLTTISSFSTLHSPMDLGLPSQFSNSGSNGRAVAIGLGVTGGFVALIILIFGITWHIRRKRRNAMPLDESEIWGSHEAKTPPQGNLALNAQATGYTYNPYGEVRPAAYAPVPTAMPPPHPRPMVLAESDENRLSAGSYGPQPSVGPSVPLLSRTKTADEILYEAAREGLPKSRASSATASHHTRPSETGVSYRQKTSYAASHKTHGSSASRASGSAVGLLDRPPTHATHDEDGLSEPERPASPVSIAAPRLAIVNPDLDKDV
ncbi:Oxidoreductase family, C-terminal alpha/beta domain [Rhizoctonia solani]|uniref:Oxidoreductase family, C-terminal alpha/beta domain n=1 Tax=Rhizoctonia solani TaxID=456999 RepID=A0A8H7I7Y7_9AGAM|nr:Oxidoreductase family, C-terminal alpha/beta domain [Rhizoctonia solani]